MILSTFVSHFVLLSNSQLLLSLRQPTMVISFLSPSRLQPPKTTCRQSRQVDPPLVAPLIALFALPPQLLPPKRASCHSCGSLLPRLVSTRCLLLFHCCSNCRQVDPPSVVPFIALFPSSRSLFLLSCCCQKRPAAGLALSDINPLPTFIRCCSNCCQVDPLLIAPFIALFPSSRSLFLLSHCCRKRPAAGLASSDINPPPTFVCYCSNHHQVDLPLIAPFIALFPSSCSLFLLPSCHCRKGHAAGLMSTQ
jgi:hypothetical protein